jgi:hypothetical protein
MFRISSNWRTGQLEFFSPACTEEYIDLFML